MVFYGWVSLNMLDFFVNSEYVDLCHILTLSMVDHSRLWLNVYDYGWVWFIMVVHFFFICQIVTLISFCCVLMLTLVSQCHFLCHIVTLQSVVACRCKIYPIMRELCFIVVAYSWGWFMMVNCKWLWLNMLIFVLIVVIVVVAVVVALWH